MRFTITLTAALVLGAVPLTAFATVLDYQTAAQSNAGLTHLWSFDGEDDAARLADSEGSANLSEVSSGAESVDLGVAGLDATSTAADTKRTAAGAGAALRSSNIAMTNTVSLEVLFKPTDHLVGYWGQYVISNVGKTSTERGGFLWRAPNNSWFPTPPPENTLVTTIGTDGGVIEGSKQLVVDHWYFAALTATYDGSTNTTLNAWIADLTDGETSLTQTVTGATFDGKYGGTDNEPPMPLSIGAGWGNVASSTGANRFDEVAVYNATLTGSDFQSHLDAIRVPEPVGLTLLLAAMPILCLFRFRRG